MKRMHLKCAKVNHARDQQNSKLSSGNTSEPHNLIGGGGGLRSASVNYGQQSEADTNPRTP